MNMLNLLTTTHSRATWGFAFAGSRIAARTIAIGLLTTLLAGCGAKSDESTGETGPAASTEDSSDGERSPASDSPAAATVTGISPPAAPAGSSKAAVYAAVDDAIAKIEAGDIRGFVERHIPLDDLRRMREAGADAFESSLAEVQNNPQAREAFNNLKLKLQGARQATPEIDETIGIATLEILPLENGAEETVTDVPPPIDVETTSVEVTGYGDNLSTVLDKALAALKDGDVKGFVANMFPVSELRRPDAEERLQSIVAQTTAQSGMLEAMEADLELLKTLTPDKSSTEIVYSIPGNNRGHFKTPDRTVVFQMVEGSWRFCDNTSSFRTQQSEMSRLPRVDLSTLGGSSATPPVIELERIGDQWRFRRLPPPR